MTGAYELVRAFSDTWCLPGAGEADGWLLRAASGVTKRANSALPPPERARQRTGLVAARDYYHSRRLPFVVQVPTGGEYVRLDAELAASGAVAVDETLLMSRQLSGPVSDDVATDVVATDRPDDVWFDLWWSVNGRGGPDQASVANVILTSSPSRYLALMIDGAARGVARLTPSDGFAVISCMAVNAEYRRAGYGRRLLAAAAAEARLMGQDELGLQVVAENRLAGRLYLDAGFRTIGGYRYRVGRPADGS